MNIFEYLTDEELNKYTYIKNYKTSSIIFNEEQECNKIGFIISGSIKIITLTHTEKEEIITLLKTNDYFGDILTFSNTPYYLGHAICLKETTVRYISKQNLLLLFKLNQRFLEKFLSLLSTKALHLKQENKLFKHKNIKDRITHYLMSMEKNHPNGLVYIFNVSDFSRLLSIPRPSVSRELSSMINEGLIIKGKDSKGVYLKRIKN